MEAVRPDVDGWLLAYLGRRTFGLKEVVEQPDGHVTLMPSITHELCETLQLWREKIAPIVQAVVDGLLASTGQLAALAEALKPKAPLAYRKTDRRTPRPQPIRAGVAATQADPIQLTQRRCALCESLTTDTSCSPECAQADATRAALAPQLDDPANRTPEAWSMLWPCLARLPLARMCKAAGLSKPWASRVRSGPLVPSPATWPLLCRA